MTDSFFEDAIFDKTTIQDVILKDVEFDNCTFLNCDLSNQDFSDAQFTDCEFTDCNLSLIRLAKTALRNCKMLGLRFDDCNAFGLAFTFENCILNYSSFFKTSIRNTLFRNSQLVEVDLSESNLTGSVFDNCNLSGAVFEHTVLDKADLATSYHYSINPETNRIKKAKFSYPGVLGLLNQYDIEIIE